MLPNLMMMLATVLGAPPSLDADELVGRHEEGLAKIHSVRAVVELKTSDDGGKSWKTVNIFKVWRSGQKERMTIDHFLVYVSGAYRKSRRFTQILTTPEGQRILSKPGGDEPIQEPVDTIKLEFSSDRISGLINPPRPFGSAGYKEFYTQALLYTPGLYTVRELCEATGRVMPKASRDALGDETWEMDLRNREGKRRYHVSFAPKYNYLVNRQITTDEHGNSFDHGANFSVEEFQEPKPGIFMPKTIRSSAPGKPSIIDVLEVRDVAVNEPIPEKEFTLRFPVGILVQDNTHDSCFYIWGDGKPQRTFKTAAELNQWGLERSRH
jgi:hypothetical protein